MTDRDPRSPEYQQRQLELMRDRLLSYRNGMLRLATLIGDLEALLGVLGDTDSAWQQNFRDRWGILAEVYSVSRYRGTSLDDLGHGHVTGAVVELLQLVESKLEGNSPS